jgi:hypothetical protein
MDANVVQTPIAAAPGYAVPMQALPPPAAHAPPLAIIQQDANPARVQGNGAEGDRVWQQLRWIEKLVFVSIFLALFAIFKK